MSLSDNYSALRYESDGQQKTFPISWRFFEPETVKAFVYDGIRIAKTLAYESDYTVEKAGDKGGSLTLSAAVESGKILVIVRQEQYVQLLELLNSGKLDLEKLEEALDHIVMLTQQNRDSLSRTLTAPPGSSLTPEEYTEEMLQARDNACECAEQAAASAKEAKNHAANTAEIKAAALRELREEGDKQAERLNDLAANHILTFEREIERAHEEADRACECANRAEEALDQIDTTVSLAKGLENLERTYTLTEDVNAGDTLTLEGILYYVGRNTLRLNWEGVELFRGQHFEEIGTDGQTSNLVRSLISIPEGDRLNAWVVSSNIARHVEEEADRAEQEADRSCACADRACACADTSCECAKQAETAKDIAQNAAQEATDQADRAEQAADDAEEASEEAKLAACLVGKGKIAVLREKEFLLRVPSGFFIIDEDMVVPATCAQPLVSVEKEEDIPTAFDCFILIAGKMECTDSGDGGGGGGGGGGDGGGGGPKVALCGQRVKRAKFIKP